MSITESTAIVIALGLGLRWLLSGRPLWFKGAAEVGSADVATALRKASTRYDDERARERERRSER